jgi:hypothetical protein
VRSLVVAVFAAALFAAGPVRAQTPTTPVEPENLAAARQLIRVFKEEDQFKANLPTLITLNQQSCRTGLKSKNSMTP